MHLLCIINGQRHLNRCNPWIRKNKRIFPLLIRNFNTFTSKATKTDRIRNLGIIAHIDAGKTTVTEQLLFLSGRTPTAGSVDDGSTITDFMDIERERGITIQSAAVSFNWHDHRINLIDTPGHVDFTIEVERSLRVVDGIVTVLDGSAGVQAQTLTVWRQANKYHLPSIFFINKMDKPSADFKYVISTIEDRLITKVVPVILPILNNDGHIESFVDVLNRKYLPLNRLNRLERHEFVGANKTLHQWLEIPKNTRLEEDYVSGFEDMCLRLADVDKHFEQKISTFSNLIDTPLEEIVTALRRNTLKKLLSPVACGSALHSSASVKPILDMVINFLPNPEQRDNHIADELDICAFVFKVRHDKKRGQLNYIRLFRGTFESTAGIGLKNTILVNANTGEHQTDYQIFNPFSDVLQPITRVDEGNIAVLTGLKDTKTGHTLVNCTHQAHKPVGKEHVDFEEFAPPFGKHFNKNLAHFALEGIDAPLPVFTCSIEPPNQGSVAEFQRALSELLMEDPSLRTYDDPNTGQKIVQGMGELQIEVLKERLLREYNLNVFLGPLQVAYREMPTTEAEHSEKIEAVVNRNGKNQCSLRLHIEPNGEMDREKKFEGIELALDTEVTEVEDVEKAHKVFSSRQGQDLLRAINDGCMIALHNGPMLSLPVSNLRVLLKSFTFVGRPSSTLLSACASKCLTEALKKSNIHILEPLVTIEVTVVADGTTRMVVPEHIIHELTKRRATIMDVDNKGRIAVIHATIPLSETFGLAKTIRTVSSGLATFHMESSGYQPVETKNVHSQL